MRIIKKSLLFLIVTCFVFVSIICTSNATIKAQAEELGVTVDETNIYENESNTAEQYEEIKTDESYIAQISNYVVTIVLGAVGSLFIALSFMKKFIKLTGSVSTALGFLDSENKNSKKEILNAKDEVENSINSLKNIKNEIFELNEQQFIKMHNEIMELRQAVIYLTAGTKELVVNGVAESVSNLLKENKKEDE